MIKISNVQVFNFEGALRGLRNPLDSWALSDSKYPTIHQTDKETIRNLAEEIVTLFEKEGMKKDGYMSMNDDEWESMVEYVEEQVSKDSLLRDHYFNTAFIGPKDLTLAQRMVGAGTDESKFMRQIQVTMDIEAPLYWWKEFDTYKVGTVANSCSTMHKLCSKPITEDSFAFDEGDFALSSLDTDDYLLVKDMFKAQVKMCEFLRQRYLYYTETAKNTSSSEVEGYWRQKANVVWRALVQILPNGWMQKRTVTLNYQVLRAMYFARKNHKLVEWRQFCDYIREELPYAIDLICYERRKTK